MRRAVMHVERVCWCMRSGFALQSLPWMPSGAGMDRRMEALCLTCRTGCRRVRAARGDARGAARAGVRGAAVRVGGGAARARGARGLGPVAAGRAACRSVRRGMGGLTGGS